MKYLAIGVAVAVVTAGLALLALWILRQTQTKKRSAWRWMSGFFGCWLGVLAAAALGARTAHAQHFGSEPGFWAVFVPAAMLAFGVAATLGWRLTRLPSLAKSDPKPAADSGTAPPSQSPRPSALIPPTPVPAPPPTAHPPEIIAFKFACPHCGQRLSVTTADIGTSAECPSCQAPLTIPAPPQVDASSAPA